MSHLQVNAHTQIQLDRTMSFERFFFVLFVFVCHDSWLIFKSSLSLFYTFFLSHTEI